MFEPFFVHCFKMNFKLEMSISVEKKPQVIRIFYLWASAITS